MPTKKKTKKQIRTRRWTKSTLVIVLLMMVTILLPQKSIGATGQTSMEFPIESLQTASVMNHLYQDAEPHEISRWSTSIIVTSYNSVPEQTDSTPFTTASGTQVRDGVAASNYLPIGTHIRLPDLFGSKVFVIEDRMNSRYQKRLDIWSADLDFSKKFGVRYLRMDIL